MKPTTTPGKASGNVSSETSRPRPGKRLRCRKMPAMQREHQRDDGDAGGQRDGGDQAAEVALGW